MSSSVLCTQNGTSFLGGYNCTTNFLLNYTNFTMCAFVRPTGTQGNNQRTYLSVYTVSDPSFFQVSIITPSFSLQPQLTTFNQTTGGTTLLGINVPNEQWIFVGATVNNTANVSLYSKLVGTSTCSVASASDQVPDSNVPTFGIDGLGVINGQATQNSLHAYICEVRIWNNIALNADEMDRESEQLTPCRRDNLYAYWPLSRNVGLRDAIGGLTLVPATTTGFYNQASGPTLPDKVTNRSPLRIRR